MPELPEAETIRLGLIKYLVGHKIIDIKVNISKIFIGDKKDAIGTKIIDIRRIGKGLIIDLDNGFCLAVHLKMTGQLIYQDKKTKNIKLSAKVGGEKLPSKYTHVTIFLDKDAYLYYNDLRQFGWIKILKKDELLQTPFFRDMGPEPEIVERGLLQNDKVLTFKIFNQILKNASRSIKPLLMDQKKLGGIGNIYANESLFEAGISPSRQAKSLDTREIERLYKAIIKVLEKSLRYGGSSDENFVNALGQEGEYQNHFSVYNKKGESCLRGNGIIQKIKLGGRGTYFCPSCQK